MEENTIITIQPFDIDEVIISKEVPITNNRTIISKEVSNKISSFKETKKGTISLEVLKSFNPDVVPEVKMLEQKTETTQNNTVQETIPSNNQPFEMGEVTPINNQPFVMEEVTPINNQPFEMEEVTPINNQPFVMEEAEPINNQPFVMEEVTPINNQPFEMGEVTPINNQPFEIGEVTPINNQPFEIGEAEPINNQPFEMGEVTPINNQPFEFDNHDSIDITQPSDLSDLDDEFLFDEIEDQDEFETSKTI